jgi:hypothetical protein
MPIIFLDWVHQLMYVHDQLLIIISSSGMLALLVLVLDHQSFGRSYGVMMVFTAILGGVAAPLIIARPLVSL